MIYLVALCSYIIYIPVRANHEFIGILIQCCNVMVTFSAPALVSTIWIPRRIQPHWFISDEPSVQSKSLSMQPASQTPIQTKMLDDMLGDEGLLEKFATHLNQEFSLECLLSFIELTQFKQHFNMIYFGKNDGKVYTFGDLELKSDIVYDTIGSFDNKSKEEIILDFKKIARLLYLKYIKEWCELEVNVSGRTRRELYEMMEEEQAWMDNKDMTADRMPCVFEDVCREMFKLMGHSFKRLRHSQKMIA